MGFFCPWSQDRDGCGCPAVGEHSSLLLMKRLCQAPIPLPSPRPPLHYFLWRLKEDHVVSGSQAGLKGSEKCLGGGGHWHRGPGCWLRPPPLQRSPGMLTHRAGFVCGGPWRAARPSAKHGGLTSPGESLPQPQGHQENGRHRVRSDMAVLSDMEGKETTSWGTFSSCFQGPILTRRAAGLRLTGREWPASPGPLVTQAPVTPS